MKRSVAVRSTVALLVTLGVAPAVAARPDEGTPEQQAERDRLIDQIARGADLDRSARRFGELRAAVLGAHDAEVAEKVQQRATHEAQRAWKEAYAKTADHEVGWRCTLSPDPTHPVPSREGRFKGDWGKVVRKAEVRLPPKNELDEGEKWTMVEVAGRKRSYLIHADRYGLPDRAPLQAEVGDLVLVCDGGSDASSRWKLPPEWTGEVQTSGFAVPVAAPPRIAQKAKWNPVHVTHSFFFRAIKDVKWQLPDEAFVLSNLEIGAPADGGRFLIDEGQGLSWLLEVPPGLKHRDALVPGRNAWVILGRHRYDRELKKLVLVAEDVEERYVVERGERR